ncbi:hypothetical protein HY620_02915 [Candidatus Uhrbacteria bacterium]|nr:hypothetical protein [Candidatus Uhrbacteria bacterium]
MKICIVCVMLVLAACATNMKAPVDPPVQVNVTTNIGALPTYGTATGSAPVYFPPQGQLPQQGVIVNTNPPSGGYQPPVYQQPVGQPPIYQPPVSLPTIAPTITPPAAIPTPAAGVYATVTEIVSGNNRFARVVYDTYNKLTRINLPFGWLGATLVPYDETFTGFLEAWSGVTVRGAQETNAVQLIVMYDITVIPVNSTNGSFYHVQASVPQGQIPATTIPRVWFATRINNARAVNTPGRIQVITDPTDPNKETFRF